MAGGINLHGAVRSAITFLHPDEEVLWYKSTGQENVKGRIVPRYTGPTRLMAQIQSDGDDALRYEHRLGDNDFSHVFYLYTPTEGRVAGIIRPEARNGDFLMKVSDKTWWLVTAVLEDFSTVNWEKVRGVWQVYPPDVPMPLSEGDPK